MKLKKHHIARLFDATLFKNSKGEVGLALIQEYFSADLNELLVYASDAQLTLEHVKNLFYSLMCTLNFLHSANIMHRDIKPANLLLEDQSKVVLCDLGLARTPAVPASI